MALASLATKSRPPSEWQDNILHTSQLHLTSALILLHIWDPEGFRSQGRLTLPHPGKLCPQQPQRSWVFHLLILTYYVSVLQGTSGCPLFFTPLGWRECLSWSVRPSALPEHILLAVTWCYCFLAVLLKAQVQEKGTHVFLCHYPRVCTSLAYRRFTLLEPHYLVSHSRTSQVQHP